MAVTPVPLTMLGKVVSLWCCDLVEEFGDVGIGMNNRQ